MDRLVPHTRRRAYPRETDYVSDAGWFRDGDGVTITDLRLTNEYPESAEQSQSPDAAAPGIGAELRLSSQPRFFFELRGGVASDAIAAEETADLIFNFEVPPLSALSFIDSTALEEARRANVKIQLHVTGRGAITVCSASTATASFEDARLHHPVVVKLRASSSHHHVNGVHVNFSVNGTVVHQTEIALRVVGTLPPTKSDEKATQLLQGSSVPMELLHSSLTVPPQVYDRIQIALSYDGGKLRLDLTHLRQGLIDHQEFFLAKRLERNQLETLLQAIRGDLKSCYSEPIWQTFDGNIPPGRSRKAVESTLKKTTQTVAEAGWRFFNGLSQDEGIRGAINYIEQLPDESVLTVSTDDIFLPWEIAYSSPRSRNMTSEQKEASPVQADRFWGARFAIETVQHGAGSIGKLRRTQLAALQTISVNVNPTLDEGRTQAGGKSSSPFELLDAWTTRLSQAGKLNGLQNTCESMREILQNASKAPSLIYVLCHGDSGNPFGGEDEILQLDEDCCLKPNDLEVGNQYASAPIIFLNACRSGAHSPLTLSSFPRMFRRRGALGMIAATSLIPVCFGTHFGAEVVDGYLARQGSMARTMLNLRRRHLLERWNPVPLFYSLQCQLDW